MIVKILSHLALPTPHHHVPRLKELTSLAARRYNSGHRKGRLKILILDGPGSRSQLRRACPPYIIRPGGLPPKNPIIGRAEELAAVQERLSTSSVVTVVGTGRIGKRHGRLPIKEET